MSCPRAFAQDFSVTWNVPPTAFPNPACSRSRPPSHLLLAALGIAAARTTSHAAVLWHHSGCPSSLLGVLISSAQCWDALLSALSSPLSQVCFLAVMGFGPENRSRCHPLRQWFSSGDDFAPKRHDWLSQLGRGLFATVTHWAAARKDHSAQDAAPSGSLSASKCAGCGRRAALLSGDTCSPPESVNSGASGNSVGRTAHPTTNGVSRFTASSTWICACASAPRPFSEHPRVPADLSEAIDL